MTEPDLDGKTYIVTGANTGIGRVTALELARRGGRVMLATRSKEKTDPVLAEITATGGRAEWVPLDLSSLASVRSAADDIHTRTKRLDGLVDNAGLAGSRGMTNDGFEITFGTNHLGHFLLTTLLMDLLEASAPSRVVVVSSKAHYRAKSIDWDGLTMPTKSLTGFPEYSVSKLCNVLFAHELARRAKDRGIHTYALHPGVIASDIWRRIPWPLRPILTMGMLTTEEGARAPLHCIASTAAEKETGLYYDADCRLKEPSDLAKSDSLAQELWQKSEDWTRSAAARARAQTC